MTFHRPHVLLAAVLALCTLSSTAEPQQTVITATRSPELPRDDIKLLCPGIAETLTRDLMPVLERQGERGVSRLQFRWQGARVQEVEFKSGPQVYRQPIRRALQGLECSMAANGDRFALAIRFEPDAEDRRAGGGADGAQARLGITP